MNTSIQIMHVLVNTNLKKMFGPQLQVVCRFGISRSSFLFDYILNVGMVHLM